MDWGYSGSGGFIDVENEYVTAAEKEIAAAVKKLTDEGFTVKQRYSRQSIRADTNMPKKNHISLICIATHGRGGFEHFLWKYHRKSTPEVELPGLRSASAQGGKFTE